MATSTIKSPFVERTSTLAYNVDISGYTASNRYIAPTDGYVWVRTTSSCVINLYNISHSVRAVNSAETDGALFVQKGTSIYVQGTTTYAYFRAYGYV